MRPTRGRPPLDDDDDSVGVYVSLPSREYDQVCEQAQRERVSVPEVLRRSLRATRGPEKKYPK